MDEDKTQQRLAGLERQGKVLLAMILVSLSASLVSLILVLVVVVLSFA